MRNVEPAADIEPPERPARSRRRNEKRPEIAQAIAILAGSVEWETSPDGRRCKLVEQHLNKPSGWVKLRTLRRAIADRESMPSQ